ncbi:DNA internalization-related competence protein ComEC/Rec2 [Undibacterium sp. RuRC25W]|uniref:DNA internalization-related competence protein ComEC/Rec2 n=1 Tax=Undibacterium sp. RuRC25W TaxID=3413047 RepID=UPI003BF3B705
MRAVCVSFVVGIACLQQQAALFPVAQLCSLIAVALIIFVLIQRFISSSIRADRWRTGNRSALAFIVGFVWASLFAHYYLYSSLSPNWENKDLVLVGTVDSLPMHMAEGQRFIFAVDEVREGQMIPSEQSVFPKKISLSWYQTGSSDAQQNAITLQPGERWQLKVRLKRPHGTANPDGFDYEVWLLEQGVRATGTVRVDNDGHERSNRRLNAFVWTVGNLIERGRALLRDRIHEALPNSPYASVIVALVIGDQREIPKSDWTIFNRVGIGHLISISGLHITMVAGLFSGLVAFLWRRSFFASWDLPLYVPVQKMAALAGAMTALLYVALAGFGVPSQRTMYMLLVVALALWTGRLSNFSTVLSLALVLVVSLDPWAVLSPGFWLSFGAVAVIIFAAGGQLQPLADGRAQNFSREVRIAGRTQYAVTVGLVPLTMLLFGQVSLIGPLANAIAIPLVSFLVTPLALFGSILPKPLSVVVLKLAHVLIQGLVWVLQRLSDTSFAVWNAALPSFPIFLLALIGTCWLLMPKGWPMRWLGVICCFPLIFQRPLPVANNELRVIAFDVGQGMSLLLETAHHRLLYDTGPMYSPESDGGNRVILPYFKARGIHALDMMMVSHNDSDHSGGALTIILEVH